VAQPGAKVLPALDAVLLRGLSKKPEQRFERLSSLVSALRVALSESPAQRAGSLADTLPAVTLAQRNSRASQPQIVVKQKLPLWPFALALVGGLTVIGLLAPDAPEAPGSALTGRVEVPPLAPGVGTAVPVAPPALAVKVAEAGADARVPADAGAPLQDELAHLSAFEREERAKDALERAQRALTRGEREVARAALDEAYRYDPEHPDIAELRSKL
jgi:hypothetical protein